MLSKTLLKDLKSSDNYYRKRAIDKCILYILNKELTLSELEQQFFTSNDNLTSSIIQILSTIDEKKQLLEWFEDYFTRDTSKFSFENLHNEKSKTRHIRNSLKKYCFTSDSLHFFIYYLQELHTRVRAIRKQVIIEHNSEVYWLKRHASHYPIVSNQLSLNLDQLIDSDIDVLVYVPIEKIQPFIRNICGEYKAEIDPLLTYYQFMCEILNDLCKVGLTQKDLYFPLSQYKLLDNDNLLLSTVGLSNFFNNLKTYVSLSPISYQVLRGSFDEKITWEQYLDTISSNLEWYFQLSLEEFDSHILGRKLHLLVLEGNENAFTYFVQVCLYHRNIYKQISIISLSCVLKFLNYVGERVFWKETERNFEIGHKWEVICRSIANQLFGEIKIHKRIPNKSIPDIFIQQESIIIECKKSLSFAKIGSEYDINNNMTTIQYINYCRELHYWILQKPDISKKILMQPSINVVFGEEFLKDNRITEVTKKDIKDLLTISLDSQINEHDFHLIELCNDILN